MKRATALACIVALGAFLGGCGKDDSRSAADTATRAKPAEQAIAVEPAKIQPDASRSSAVQTRQARNDDFSTVAVAQLPRQAVETLRLIQAGGPFPYEKDGVVFGNRERLLPRRTRGYYHEYTVPTPRARDRGARRIVCGGPKRQIEDCYYSDDHYASFKRIAG
ncbi:ribonuclease [Caballeronia sp. LZ062]|uniref:ribonuclease n=1 Tax=unclassified Caballeronia TaxID=2646786 RepID=UPI002854242E|nr:MULTISPECIES: ribonuclease [unclassified Caballeronia]MDR5855398.1 ribonuclease [Caballeronia sp. LZ050]MDR5870074.1 ribonuclease [Caballeronia sp. LZ062]